MRGVATELEVIVSRHRRHRRSRPPDQDRIRVGQLVDGYFGGTMPHQIVRDGCVSPVRNPYRDK